MIQALAASSKPTRGASMRRYGAIEISSKRAASALVSWPAKSFWRIWRHSSSWPGLAHAPTTRSRLMAVSRPHPRQPLIDDLLGLAHGAVDQLLHGRDVLDEARDHAARPGAGVHLALLHDARIDAADLGDDVLEGDRSAEILLLRDQSLNSLNLLHPFFVLL